MLQSYTLDTTPQGPTHTHVCVCVCVCVHIDIYVYVLIYAYEYCIFVRILMYTLIYPKYTIHTYI